MPGRSVISQFQSFSIHFDQSVIQRRLREQKPQLVGLTDVGVYLTTDRAVVKCSVSQVCPMDHHNREL